MRSAGWRAVASGALFGGGLLALAPPAHAARLPPQPSVWVSHWGQGTVVSVTSALGAAPYTLTEQDGSGAVVATVPCDAPSPPPAVVDCTTGATTGPADSWTATTSDGVQSLAAEAPRAMWVEDVHPTTGDTTSWVFPDQPANIVAAAAADGVGELFMAVPYGALTAQTAQYQQLITDAQAQGITVDALSGDPSWATDGGTGVTGFVDAVIAYDQANPQSPFSGVHLDIEPWALSPTWQTDQGGADITGYLSALQEATSLAGGAGLLTEADITDWLDTVKVPGSSQDLALAVQAAVDQVTIMSYQPDAADQYSHAQAELAELAPNGRVRLAADTVPGDPGTYAGQTDDAMWTQLAALDSMAVPEFDFWWNYLGVALFDYTGTAQLPPGSPSQVTVSAVPATTAMAMKPAAVTSAGVSANPTTTTWRITVTVSGSPGSPTPTGEVSLLDNGAYLAGGLLGAQGSATFTESLPSADGLTARYSGDSFYAPSTHSLTAQTIRFGPTPASATYGDSVDLTATGGGSGLPVVFSEDPASASCAVTPDGHVTFTRVGTCLVDASQSGNDAYAPAPTAQTAVAVVPAPLTVTVSDESALFGHPIPSPAYHYTGFVNGDTATTAVTGQPACATAAPGSPGGTYPITCDTGSVSAPNYTLSSVPGTLTITYTAVVSSHHRGPLLIAANQALLIGRQAVVDGPVIVEPGGSLDIEGADVHGTVLAWRADALRVCSSRLDGGLWSEGTEIAMVGDDATSTCGPNTIKGPVRVYGSPVSFVAAPAGRPETGLLRT